MTFGRKPDALFRFIASVLLASVLVVLALAANPHWHELAHGDAEHCEHGDHSEHGEHEHGCAVALFLSGSVHHAPPAPLALAPPIDSTAEHFIATTTDVASIFLSGLILEHAPPASA